MDNTHCKDCKNKTKLLIKLPKGKHTYICEQATVCPFTKRVADEETKLNMEVFA